MEVGLGRPCYPIEKQRGTPSAPKFGTSSSLEFRDEPRHGRPRATVASPYRRVVFTSNAWVFWPAVRTVEPPVSRCDRAPAERTLGEMDEPIELPINGVLDLHTFRPQEIKDLVPDYLAECQARGILQVRIIHGKGIGNLRRTVHAILARHPEVVSYALDHPEYGGWGATLVSLRQGASKD